MKAEYERIDERLRQISEQLATLPDGVLICAQNGHCYKWYQSHGNTRVYIPKSNQILAEQLAEKKYLSCLFQDLSQKKKTIEHYLRDYKKNKNKAEQLLDNPEYRNLLAEHYSSLQRELEEWQTASYKSNTNHSEHLKIKTASGYQVRSKSEALIDMMLCMRHLPFRYECELQLGDIVLYPDFTIRHPRTGEIYYWEHFGMMDSPEYRRKVISKLELYMEYGIYPNQNLITTYETAENPLDAAKIEAVLNQYFL